MTQAANLGALGTNVNSSGDVSLTTGVTGTLPASSLPTGSVLQVVNADTSTTTSTTSASFVTANLSVSITPSSSTSKILILVSGTIFINTFYSGILTVYRGTTSGTNLGNATWGMQAVYGAGVTTGGASVSYLDSPATTSATTYTVAIAAESGATTTFNPNGQKSTITLLEIAA
jgi:hypothetical protein